MARTLEHRERDGLVKRGLSPTRRDDFLRVAHKLIANSRKPDQLRRCADGSRAPDRLLPGREPGDVHDAAGAADICVQECRSTPS